MENWKENKDSDLLLLWNSQTNLKTKKVVHKNWFLPHLEPTYFPALLNEANIFQRAQDTTQNSAQEPENQFFQAFPVCFLTISLVRE